VDFKNTVIILTSNTGSAEIAALEERRDLDADTRAELLQTTALNALRSQFRPEFINRLDEIVVYRRLGREQIRSIVDIQLKQLAQRLADRELELEVTLAAKDYLAEVGFDPQFGARPLKRAIQKHLENALAARVLGGDFLPGETVVVDHLAGGLHFSKRTSTSGSDRTPPEERPN
jgi:ATP-dependent Clp protease ATP-binding subunit ClpB